LPTLAQLQLQSHGRAPTEQLFEAQIVRVLLQVGDAVLTEAQTGRHLRLREVLALASGLQQLAELSGGDEGLRRESDRSDSHEVYLQFSYVQLSRNTDKPQIS
jgi:hypothetical protein